MWYHDWVGYEVVDAVLEDIRLGMEANDPRLNQRRLAALRYLGEMYNYRVIDSSIVFAALYSLLFLGAPLADDGESERSLDPPVHLFRIRLVVALLQTCGEYFRTGSSARKLQCFLNYFQRSRLWPRLLDGTAAFWDRYYWRKKSLSVWTEERPFPVEVKNLVLDMMEELRPDLKSTPLPRIKRAGAKLVAAFGGCSGRWGRPRRRCGRWRRSCGRRWPSPPPPLTRTPTDSPRLPRRRMIRASEPPPPTARSR